MDYQNGLPNGLKVIFSDLKKEKKNINKKSEKFKTKKLKSYLLL